MKKICIDPGHGGRHPGAVSGDLVEKDIALKISMALRASLEARGYETVMTRVSDAYVSIRKRAAWANLERCDFFISVHLNADPDPDEPGMHEASGEEILVYSVRSAGYAVAVSMLPEIDKLVPGAIRGVKIRPDLGVLSYTQMPAMLIECGFIDNKVGGKSLFKRPEVAGEIVAQAFDQAYRAYLEQPR
ncbi:N-acetylmuramoyl-L-alanine amidase [Oceanidesulfovibrio marinus]|nr:N-acetylmuramoyl-L-alanine amidase [Oceanidesulfovibrio marinus]